MTRTVPRGAAAPPHPPSRDLGKGCGPMGDFCLRFAPSEVGLSLGRQNLDHNSTLCLLALPSPLVSFVCSK
jgi:hypothetical protein